MSSIKELQQSPGMLGATKAPSPQQWFISEIQQMMHGFGDCRKPLHESAVLVEEITQQQMATMLLKAADVAYMRGSKLIGAEDILFLMRKDKVKLRRLMRYMMKKDQKSAAVRSASIDEEEAIDVTSDSKSQPVGKRQKICSDFLSSIDQTGELMDLLDDEEEDDVKYERLLRAELRSRCLDHQQYLDYCEARHANFSRRYKSQRFRDWLTSGVNLEVKPNIPALEIMSYMAYETVAQIVDLALLVKQDKQAGSSDPVRSMVPSVAYSWTEAASTAPAGTGTNQKFPGLTSPTASPPSTPVSGQSTPTTTGIPQQLSSSSSSSKSKSKKKKKSGLPATVEPSVTITILPADIQEAMRRYTQFIGPFASEMKVNTLTSPKFHLLSC